MHALLVSVTAFTCCCCSSHHAKKITAKKKYLTALRRFSNKTESRVTGDRRWEGSLPSDCCLLHRPKQFFVTHLHTYSHISVFIPVLLRLCNCQSFKSTEWWFFFFSMVLWWSEFIISVLGTPERQQIVQKDSHSHGRIIPHSGSIQLIRLNESTQWPARIF